MTFGVTTDGFVTKRLADIKLEMEADMRDVFGDAVDLTAESPLGQIVGIFAEREAALWELAEGVYQSQYPDTASGVNLDNAVALTGITRQAATKSRVLGVELTGTAGTEIPVGSVVNVEGDDTARFVLDATVTLNGSGEGTGDFTAETEGALAALAETLTVIATPVSGWDTVSNPEDADVGKDVETDAELKLRRSLSLRRAGGATVEAIRADILEVSGVTGCTVLENTTLVTDGNGLPPKSFQAIVSGGDDDDVANAIWLSKPAGIESYGDTPVTITDSQDIDHDIYFSRPVDLDIYVELDIEVDDDYPEAGDDAVEAAILEYGEGLGLGEDVIVYPHLVAALAAVPGITDVVVRIGTAASPTLDDNITVTPFQRAAFDTSRITVNS